MLTRGAGLVAAAIALGTAIAYVILIARQGEDEIALVILVTAMILGAAVAAAVGGSTTDPRRKSLLLGASAGVLLSLGYLSLFSIGLFLVLGGIASTIAWIRAMGAAGAGGRPGATLAFLGGAVLPWLIAFL